MDIRNDYRKLSRDDKIRCLRKWGLQVEEIAWEFDMSDSNVFRIINDNEITAQRKRSIVAWRRWLDYKR